MRRKLFSSLVAAGLAVAVAGPAHAAPAWDSTDSWSSAAQWLEGELAEGVLLGPPTFPGVPADPDWGMTIDMLIVVRASKLEPALAQSLTEKIAANVDSYATSAAWGDPDEIIGGATAKLLFAAVAAGGDPLDFGGHNMRERTLALIGADGWIHSSNDGSLTAGGNLFDQSLAVLGLAGSGEVPGNVLQFLLKQQCDDGGFPIGPLADPSGECLSNAADERALPMPHVDATAMAVQALYAVGKKEQADKAVAWLASVQQPNGGFYDTWATPTTNTNSAGLAAQALFAGGKAQEAEKAAKFVRSLQLTAANAGAAGAEVGAVAKNAEEFSEGTAGAISEGKRDSWHRATTQALLALTKVPMHRIGIDTPPPPPPAASASASAAPGGGGGLPVTGPAVGTIAVVGAVVLLAGMVLLVVARRRAGTAR